jgi:hypothetical protein
LALWGSDSCVTRSRQTVHYTGSESSAAQLNAAADIGALKTMGVFIGPRCGT